MPERTGQGHGFVPVCSALEFRGQGSSRDIMLNSLELGMVSPELTDSWKTGGK